MRRLNLLLFVLAMGAPLLLAWAAGHAVPVPRAAPAAEQAQMREMLPRFRFAGLDGKAYESEAFRGKPLLLNFWASWCIPCIHEFPALLAIARAQDVTIVALSLDDTPAAAKKFLNRFGPLPDNFIVGMDEGQAISHDLFQSILVPETVIVSPGGVMSGKIAGGDWPVERMESEIKSAISIK
jgi:thiol-disulfide isomerase/thioredoxin